MAFAAVVPELTVEETAWADHQQTCSICEIRDTARSFPRLCWSGLTLFRNAVVAKAEAVVAWKVSRLRAALDEIGEGGKGPAA